MADDTNDSPNAAAGEGAAQGAAAPSMQLMTQYVRDLSFENPGAPASLAGGGQPQFNVNIQVQVKKQTEEDYAVEISLTAKAQREQNILFNAELVYGGLFRIRNVPEAQLPPLLMIECPRLIFPFARQILAQVTQNGGFPPLMMEPVDFSAIYRQNLANMAQAQKEQGGQPAN